MSTNTTGGTAEKVRHVPYRSSELASVHVSTYDAARALHLTPAGVRHLIAVDRLPCRRLPSGRREILGAAVEALEAQRARARLLLVPAVVRPRARPPRAPMQLPLFHVRRQAKAALNVREAKDRRSRGNSRGV